MMVCNEMKKLREYLDDHNIDWQDNSWDVRDDWICRTVFEVNGYVLSVINGYGTYGGFNPLHRQNIGMLEMWCKKGGLGPIGYMSAEEVIKEIETILENKE